MDSVTNLVLVATGMWFLNFIWELNHCRMLEPCNSKPSYMTWSTIEHVQPKLTKEELKTVFN